MCALRITCALESSTMESSPIFGAGTSYIGFPCSIVGTICTVQALWAEAGNALIIAGAYVVGAIIT